MWAQLFTLAVFVIILATFLFAVIGVGTVYNEYKKSKWQKKYGSKQKEFEEKTERNEWTNMEKLRDKVLLFEEITKENGLENCINEINRIISEMDYDARYNAWKSSMDKWKVFAISSMYGGLGSSEKAQTEINEDFDEYEEQRKQELRKKLNKISKGR